MGFGFNSLLYEGNSCCKPSYFQLILEAPHDMKPWQKKNTQMWFVWKQGIQNSMLQNSIICLYRNCLFGASSVFSPIHFRWVKPMNPHVWLLLVNIPFWGFEHHLQSYLLEVISIFPFCWVMFKWNFNQPPGVMSPIHHIRWCPPQL